MNSYKRGPSKEEELHSGMMMMSIVWLVSTILLSSVVRADDAVAHLHAHLRQAAGDGHTPPPRNAGGGYQWPVRVNLTTDLVGIRSFCPKTLEAELHVWEIATWHDARLQWDPTAFGDLPAAHISDASKVWVPDLALFEEAATPVGHAHFRGSSAFVMSDGSVTSVNSRAPRVKCKGLTSPSANHYVCPFSIGLWMSDTSTIDIFPTSELGNDRGGANVHYFEPNKLWQLSEGDDAFTVARRGKSYVTLPGVVFGSLEYTLRFERVREGNPSALLREDTLAKLGGALDVPPAEQRPIQAKLGLQVLSIDDFDVPRRKLSILVREHISWKDERARFSRSEYGGERSAFFHPSELWTPGITFYSETAAEQQSSDDALFHLRSNGKFYRFKPRRLTVICRDFSAEESQDGSKTVYRCSFLAGPWSYAADTVALSAVEHVSLPDTMQPNGLWAPMELQSVAQDRTYPCCPNRPYGTVEFTLTFASV